jgi:hypothetical protein
LRLEQATLVLDDVTWPMTYGISVGVNRRDPELLAELEKTWLTCYFRKQAGHPA